MNFNKTRFLCCILLGLVMLFSSVLCFFSDVSRSEIYADEIYPYDLHRGVTYIPQTYIIDGVELTGRVYYTYKIDPNGNVFFVSIEKIQPSLIGERSYLYDFDGSYGYVYFSNKEGREVYIIYDVSIKSNGNGKTSCGRYNDELGFKIEI